MRTHIIHEILYILHMKINIIYITHENKLKMYNKYKIFSFETSRKD